jgi:hypothetical protein
MGEKVMNKQDREKVEEIAYEEMQKGIDANMLATALIVLFAFTIYFIFFQHFGEHLENYNCRNESVLITGTFCCQIPDWYEGHEYCSGRQVFFPYQANHNALESEGYHCKPFIQSMVDGGYLNETKEICKQIWVKNS